MVGQSGRAWHAARESLITETVCHTGYHVLKYLGALSYVRCAAGDTGMGAIMDLVIARRDAMGRFCPEAVRRTWSPFDFGQKGLPSQGFSLLAYRTVPPLMSYYPG